MDATQAFRWSLYYRLLASLSFLLGLAIIVGTLWIGAGNMLVSLITDFGGGIESPNYPIVSVIGFFLGILVWQVGKATAFYKTLVDATQTELQDDLDHEAMKSDMLEVLDERLSDMHAEVEQTRRGVNRLQQEEHADSLMEGAGGANGQSGVPSYMGGSSEPEPSTPSNGGSTESAEPADTVDTPPADDQDSQPRDNRDPSGPSDPNAAFDES